ncbi:hypothetical protein FS749_011821 [Ceratobasidium sp. UAMH 11750]|nr:hypothetical protein FS749_011821 [Ceratobasidium sp. UAMH 11750]
MPKRKVVGAYALTDEEDDEPVSGPPPKKPYRLLPLQTPAFKLPTTSRVQSSPAPRPQPASSSRTSGQRVATPLSTRATLFTPRDTLETISRDATEPLSEIDECTSATNCSKGKQCEAQDFPWMFGSRAPAP